MTHKINTAGTAVVSTDMYWMPIDASTPRGVKAFLINKESNSATTGVLMAKETFFDHWFPLPKWKDEDE